MAQPSSTAFKPTADFQDKVQRVGTQIKDSAEQAADNLARQGAKAATAVTEGANDAYASTKKFVEEQPILAIAGVALLAFAVGALWKMSPPSRPRYGYDLLDRVADYVEPQYRSLRRRW